MIFFSFSFKQICYKWFQLKFAADTSRHYQPLPIIKNVIDSMAYAKLVRNTELTRTGIEDISDILSDNIIFLLASTDNCWHVLVIGGSK